MTQTNNLMTFTEAVRRLKLAGIACDYRKIIGLADSGLVETAVIEGGSVRRLTEKGFREAKRLLGTKK